MTMPSVPRAERSPAELMYADFSAEHASTRRMLERFADGQNDWRPHEKSRTLAQLATHVASILNTGTQMLETEEVDVMTRTPQAPLSSASELVAHFDAGARRFDAALGATTYEHLDAPWTMRMGSRVLVSQPRRVLLRTLTMHHLIHHRAQLGVYYRLLGVPVPGMYGPSADD